MSRVTLAIVDDHKVVAVSLKAYLESFADLVVVGTAASGEELLGHLDAWQPHVLLQDLLMPGGIDGVETIRRVVVRVPTTRVIALTASVDAARATAALRAGAVGYVRKDADPEILLEAVRAVAAGSSYMDPHMRLRRPNDVPAEPLTLREVDVLQEMARGRSNREIAHALGVSEDTVKSHVGRILAKLQVDNRTRAILQGLRDGLVTLDTGLK